MKPSFYQPADCHTGRLMLATLAKPARKKHVALCICLPQKTRMATAQRHSRRQASVQ